MKSRLANLAQLLAEATGLDLGWAATGLDTPHAATGLRSPLKVATVRARFSALPGNGRGELATHLEFCCEFWRGSIFLFSSRSAGGEVVSSAHGVSSMPRFALAKNR